MATDWKAEAGGLAYMIQDIYNNYMQAKQLGGDSELLASAIHSANQYVDGPLWEKYSEPIGESYEWAIFRDGDNEPHRGPMGKEEARRWLDEWEKDAPGARPGMFVLARRTVGEWELII